MKNALKNWKTTSAGVVMIVTGVLLYLNDRTKTVEALTSVLAGFGLIWAKDNDQTGI